MFNEIFRGPFGRYFQKFTIIFPKHRSQIFYYECKGKIWNKRMQKFHFIWVKELFFSAFTATCNFDPKQGEFFGLRSPSEILAKYINKKHYKPNYCYFCSSYRLTVLQKKIWRNSVSRRKFDGRFLRGHPLKYLDIHISLDFTWTDHIVHLTGKINQRLGLLKLIKHLLPFRARLLFYKSLVMPLFEYADLVWGDKHNITLMSSLQVLQNKAAKVILNRPLYLSSTEAWLISWYILMF